MKKLNRRKMSNRLIEIYTFLTQNLSHLGKLSYLFLVITFISAMGLSMFIFQLEIDKFHTDLFNSFANGLGATLLCFSFIMSYKIHQSTKIKKISPNTFLSTRVSSEFRSSDLSQFKFPFIAGSVTSIANASDLRRINENVSTLAKITEEKLIEIAEEVVRIQEFLYELDIPTK